MPEECWNKTYDKLFKHLLKEKMVALGLYRQAGATDNTYGYVFTNPAPKTNVCSRDKVFVLGSHIPQEMIINFSKEAAKASTSANGDSKPTSGTLTLETEGYGVTTTKPMATARDFYGLADLHARPQQSHIDTGTTKTIETNEQAPQMTSSIRSQTMRSGETSGLRKPHATKKKVRMMADVAEKSPDYESSVGQSDMFEGGDRKTIQSNGTGNPSTSMGQSDLSMLNRKPDEGEIDDVTKLGERATDIINRSGQGQQNNFDVLQKVVDKLRARVSTIEEKVDRVQGLLSGQSDSIRKTVTNIKEEWMDEFE